tara:strand:- start:48 stop:245 length:198 start_codon:yes stop_codon:yes gene_type:complete
MAEGLDRLIERVNYLSQQVGAQLVPSVKRVSRAQARAGVLLVTVVVLQIVIIVVLGVNLAFEYIG